MKVRYFDHNATTPLSAAAKEAWLSACSDLWQNPSSPYRAAARVRVHLQQAREELAGLLDVRPERIAFNSGATEGNNAVFAHWSRRLPQDALVGVSPTEHPSVLEAAKYYFGERVLWLSLDATGAVDLDAIPWGRLAALSVMAANNETGVLNPWGRIASRASELGVAYHCDASQWVGKRALSGLSDCSIVTACAHKFGGPRGVGFWVLPPEADEFRSFVGGAQESEHRAGTEDVASILAMCAALDRRASGAAGHRDSFIQQLTVGQVVAPDADRLWNTVMLLMPEFPSQRWVLALEKRGFLVSSGAACATGKVGPSHVLAAMGIDADAMRRSLRLSSGPDTTLDDWTALAEALSAVYIDLKHDASSSGTSVISI
ncbi:cysteine desulfurase family protein [Coraliomargarita akajimensis]|uniref:Aminotransferase class V n=1 Tax=Coraliomargarita akajimensis (strain DSM 45221 / IAM 15411 / JCM 23193 / KCTC 12865 / 04OKA010-24) TaxID=583355 RepID=D5EKQ6_CORAD|nr:aminotransferase class V-fold PLP-dependent enzyme [Coraliomargarita akajimensis]ADE54963.1 aminotransferase class V [Coraliomargarita akajimensis DSM 45221]